MAWVFVTKSKDEFICQCKPYVTRYGGLWEVDSIPLPTGSIERLIGRRLTWEDEPVELTEQTLVKPVEVTDELLRKAWNETIDEAIPVRARMIWAEGWNALARWMRERIKR